MTVLLVVSPEAFVSSTAFCLVDSKLICFVVCPLAIVRVPWRVSKRTLSTCLIVLPISLVRCTIRPCHLAFSVSHIAFPFTFKDGTSLVSVGSAFNFCLWIEHISSQSFLSFVWLEVFVSIDVVNLLDFEFPPIDPTFDSRLHTNDSHKLICCKFIKGLLWAPGTLWWHYRPS